MDAAGADVAAGAGMAVVNPRGVAAGKKFDANGIVGAVGFVVGLELCAQAAGFHADNGIDAGIVVRTAVEDFDADHVFFEFVRVTAQRVVHREAQKSGHARGAGEKAVGQNFLQLLANSGIEDRLGGLGHAVTNIIGVFDAVLQGRTAGAQRTARATMARPPTSSTSMTMVLNRLVAWK